jgi:hypothetical protein
MRRAWSGALGSLLVGGALASLAQPVALRPNPLSVAWLSVPDPTKTLMRSGCDFNDGNMDSGNLLRIEPAGPSFSNASSSWVLFEAQGPGVLTSLWLTGKSKRGEAYLSGRLSFYLDGEDAPRLWGDLPGWLQESTLFPKPLAEQSSGGWVCYAPIHFGHSLKITLSDHQDSFGHRKNGRGEAIPHLYHQFTYQQLGQPTTSSRPEDFARQAAWQRDLRGQNHASTVTLPAHRHTTVFAARGKGILNALQLGFEGVDPDQIGLRVGTDGVTGVNLSVPELWGFSSKARPAARFESLLLGKDSRNIYYCNFPMPHRTDLVVELENRGPAGSVHVQALHLPSWPEPEHFYFHAARVADRPEKGRDLKLLDQRGRGHFVGAILELGNQTLEGDDRFYVDGESFPPAWHGTGTEDYFRCGWYFHGGALTRPLYGLLDNGQPKLAYRFHLADRVNFTRAVIIGFEHGHRNEYLGRCAGTVFWYAEN